MVQERKASPAPESVTDSAPRQIRPIAGKFVLIAVLAGALLGGLTVAHRFASAAPEPEEIPPIPAMFQGWTTPDFVLFITGQTHGYLQPCGCSRPQMGGLVRRYNFMEWLKREKKWTVVPVDYGEIIADKSVNERQTALKFETNMKALETMGYAAYGMGATEVKFGLLNALVATSNIDLKRPIPLALNLDKASQKGETYFDLNVRQYVVVDTPKTKVGITSVIGPTVASLDPAVKFNNNGQIIPPALVALKKDKSEFVLMLYQGNAKEARLCAQFCENVAKKDPTAARVHLMIHAAEEEEPPGAMDDKEGSIHLQPMGHKGRYVGIVGVWRNGKGGFDTKYQLVPMGEEWITPNAKIAGHPVMKLMETEFAQRVAKQGLANLFPRNAHITQIQLQAKDVSAKYIGSAACADCHPFADQVWAKTGHAHAFQTLVDAKNPGHREKDGECIVCHTVGFMNHTGYLDKANTAKMNAKLINVGCESCHGPGSMHANDPDNNDYRKLMNAFAKHHNPTLPEKSRMQRLDDFCQKCHDIDNDVNWGKMPFEKKWAKIAHPTPKAGAQPAAQGKDKDAPPKIVEK